MLARQENVQMQNLANLTLALSKRAAENARSVRVLTIMGLVFIPISLMASVFSMMVFNNDKGRMKVSRRDLGAFFAVTSVLLFMTFVVWWIFDKKSKREEEQEGVVV